MAGVFRQTAVTCNLKKFLTMKKYINTKVKLGMIKLKVFFIFIAIFFILFKSYSQIQTFYVKPYDTDTSYSLSEDSSYIAKNPLADKNTLFLFLGGGFSHPNSYWNITYFAATLGYDAISLCYSNGTGAAFYADNPDSTFYSKFRQELCFGTPVCDSIFVDTLHSINVRLIKLLQYLDITYPFDNWGQYLTVGNEPNWQKIILAGHSLGSGNAPYIAKQFEVKGVLMFAGPNDYSTIYNQSAPWLSSPGPTGTEKYYSYLSLYDEVVSYDKQYSNIDALGMLENDDSTFVDFILPPYNNSHCLYTKQEPGLASLYHNTPIMNSSINHDVWEYMLNSLLDTTQTNLAEIENQSEYDWNIFPNPSKGSFYISGNINIPNSNKIFFSIYDLCGRKLFTEEINVRNHEVFKLNLKAEDLNVNKGAYIMTIHDSRIYDSKILIIK